MYPIFQCLPFSHTSHIYKETLAKLTGGAVFPCDPTLCTLLVSLALNVGGNFGPLRSYLQVSMCVAPEVNVCICKRHKLHMGKVYKILLRSAQKWSYRRTKS